jgi:hypothetical protein
MELIDKIKLTVVCLLSINSVYAQNSIKSKLLNRINANPSSLSSDIKLNYIGKTSGNNVKIVYDSTQHVFYTNTFNGDIYRVKILNDGTFESKIFIQASKTHTIGRAQGLLWINNSLYLAGNEVDDLNKRSKGRVIKYIIKKDGSWESPQNILTTEYYASSNVLFDHNFSALCLNKTRDSILIASGSRTDHGEIKDVKGKYPNLREEPLTSKIFVFPVNTDKEVVLKNDYNELKASGFIYCEGVRNEFALAGNSKGEIFGVENNGDRDDPEELNQLKRGKHYGFPWIMGGNFNPQQISTYDPNKDLLLPNNLYDRTIFYRDSTFSLQPSGLKFEDPIVNIGPDANWVRDPITGKFYQSTNITTFTSHRSPLGLVFDTNNVLDSPYTSNGFVLAYSTGGGASGYLNSVDSGADFCQLKFIKSNNSLNYQVSVKRLAVGFTDLVDAVMVENRIYLLQNDGTIFEITFPKRKIKPTITISSTANSIVVGDKIEFKASVNDYWEAPTYSWSVNGVEINNTSSSFISTSLADNDIVSCSISNYFESGKQIKILSNSIKIQVKPIFIQPSIVKSGNCLGSSITIKSNPLVKLAWKRDGKEIFNSNNLDSTKIDNILIAQVPGVYVAECSTIYGTYTTNSIEIFDAPQAPNIKNESELILVSSEKWGNQWYLDNSNLSGDTLQRYTVLKSGNYKVKFKNILGCSSDFSKEKNILILENEKEIDESLIITPNPFENKFKIDFKELENLFYDLELFDLFGKLVHTKYAVRNGEYIDILFLPAGKYILRLKKDSKYVKEVKLIKF